MTEAYALYHKYLKVARASDAAHGTNATNGHIDPKQKQLREARKTGKHKARIE
jgi:hypothetical protein